MKKLQQQAFTLIELSIVLVIIGLVVGSVLVGQNLIRAAELRALAVFSEQFSTDWYTFRLKYNERPGDMPNATQFWGKWSSHCPSHTGVANSESGTCNGNGDKRVQTNGTNAEKEWFRVSQHLYLAGIGKDRANLFASGVNPLGYGTYMQIKGWGERVKAFVGGNVGGSNFKEVYGRGPANPTWGMDLTGGNALQFALDNQNTQTWAAFISAEEAFSIDQKIDDGLPLKGRLRSYDGGDSTTADGTPRLPCNVLSGSDYMYNVLLGNTKACRMVYILD